MSNKYCDLSRNNQNDSLASSFAKSYAGVIAFIAVANEGSFAKAGDRLGIGRSAISRSIQKLEAQLNTRLFVRTTRNTTFTNEGELFYKNCNTGVEKIVQAMEDMRELRDGPPRGQLRISSTIDFGRKIISPLLYGFSEKYPDISIELNLSEGLVDFTTDRIDVAFRNGCMEDSQVVAKKIIPMQRIVTASPEYFQKNGKPLELEDLFKHHCINYRLNTGRIDEWEFKVSGIPQKILPRSSITFNDADVVLQAVLGGKGIAQMSGYQVCDYLRSGLLVSCLDNYSPDDQGHYLCYLNRQHLPARIRVFIDYITAHIRSIDMECLNYFDVNLTEKINLEINCNQKNAWNAKLPQLRPNA
jgi:DNA-binding transcriptional LysR family regulator